MKYLTFFNSRVLVLLISILFFSCSSFTQPKDEKIGESKELGPKGNKIDLLIKAYVENEDFNGAILVSEGGKTIYKKGFGFANMEWEVPNQVDTKFRIASITKQFTAMAIIQLASENKINLHVPISIYLPDYPAENGNKITIHHLLTHSSGIPNNYESTKEKTKRPDGYDPFKLVKEFSNLALEFEPGEKFSYSNAGYTLLGYILETITGMRYEDILQEKIFGPLQMENTGFDKHRRIIKNRADGYFNSWGMFYNANYVDMSTVYSAGGLYSTVEDLFLWDQALYSDQLLPKRYLDTIFTPFFADHGYGGHYGYGWSITERPIGNTNDKIGTIEHDGVIDGFCASFVRIPSTKSSIVFLSNVRRAPLTAMTKGIIGILFEKEYETPKRSLAYTFLDKIDQLGMEKAVDFFKFHKGSEAYYLSENEINIASYQLMTSDRTALGAEVLKLGIEALPEAFNLYDSYGELLLKLGKKEESKRNYQKSLELNPDNKNALRMLEKISTEME